MMGQISKPEILLGLLKWIIILDHHRFYNVRFCLQRTVCTRSAINVCGAKQIESEVQWESMGGTEGIDIEIFCGR